MLIVDDSAASAAILADAHCDGWDSTPKRLPIRLHALEMIEQAARAQAPFAIAVIDAAMPGIDGFVLARHLRERHRTDPAIVMMLPPVDRKTEAAQCKELGIKGYITKPYKPADLLKALLKSCGVVQSTGTEMEINLAQLDSRPASLPKAGVALKLLLVDDNPFNQKVGVLKLNRQGHKVTVAASGKEALEILDKQSFDIVFMDMHMPEMDGLEATTQIRRLEAGIGRRTPIIAMTANAGDDAREQCLQGGMDAYVAKPIQDNELFEVIRMVVPAVVSPPESLAAITPTAKTSVAMVDRAKLLSSVGGSLPVLRQLITEFRQDVGPLMDELTRSLATNDAKALHRAAHTLKGMVSFFGVSSVTELAMQLEKSGASGDFAQANDKVARFSHELECLQTDLNQAI